MAVEAYNNEIGDLDIATDLELLAQLRDVLVTNGVTTSDQLPRDDLWNWD